MTPQQIFSAKVNDLMKQARLLGPDVRKKILEMLAEARNKIVADLAHMDPARYTTAELQGLKLSIDKIMDDFRMQATNYVQAQEGVGAQLGSSSVSLPIEATFGIQPLGQLSVSTLAIAQGYTADLITGLSKDAAAKTNAAIQRAFLGGQNITDIIQQIGRATSGGQFDGMFGPIGKRAQTIAVNEILRVHSMASQSRLEDLSERHPDLRKQWLHIPASFAPRIMHIEASGQVVDVDKPFLVGVEELMYPRDPNGSAWNTINCHCLQRPYFDAAALKPTAAQKGLLESLGISVEVGHAA